VASEEDIIKAKEKDIYGVIVGKAFYEGRIDLKRLFELFKEEK
jgi:phosphoribosylformimino-5-aminoimidazole carboxamide ribotide isomerase